jgi:hypothetical protein
VGNAKKAGGAERQGTGEEATLSFSYEGGLLNTYKKIVCNHNFFLNESSFSLV